MFAIGYWRRVGRVEVLIAKRREEEVVLPRRRPAFRRTDGQDARRRPRHCLVTYVPRVTSCGEEPKLQVTRDGEAECIKIVHNAFKTVVGLKEVLP